MKKDIPQTTNSAAPVFTPNMLGSAIGLRVTDCIRAPETPNAAPHIRLKTVLAILWRTTFAPCDWTSGWNKPSIISFHPTVRDPKARDTNILIPSKTIESINTLINLLGITNCLFFKTDVCSIYFTLLTASESKVKYSSIEYSIESVLGVPAAASGVLSSIITTDPLSTAGIFP